MYIVQSFNKTVKLKTYFAHEEPNRPRSTFEWKDVQKPR